MQCVSGDEAALAVAQKVVYSDEDRKFNRETTVGLIRSELIKLTDYSLHLTKWIEGGVMDAIDFAAYLVKTCVVEEAGVSSSDFYNVIDALGKMAAGPGAADSLQQLVEIAKGTPSGSKDDKGRLLKEKKLPSSCNAGLRDDGKRKTAAGDPPGLRDRATQLFQEWARICNAPGGTKEKAYAIYISQLQSTGMIKGDDVTDRFFRILKTAQLDTAVEPRQQEGSNLSFAAVDMVAKLVVLVVKYSSDPLLNKVNLLTKVLNVTVRMIKGDHERKAEFHPHPYFRLFVAWLMDFNTSDSTLHSSNFQVLNAFAYAFLALQPLDVPGFSFAWLELISYRTFMPKLLLSNSQKGWPLFQRLLVALFKFMEPCSRNADLSEPVRLLCKGTLRVLLVLLHDFLEFLCDHHFSFCDVIPPSCIYMRNLILSAFPRNMRLPDPFTPNLKVDLLPEISQSLRILSDVEAALKTKQLKSEVDDFIKNRNQSTLISMDLKRRLSLSPQEALASGMRYNVPLLNALVPYVGKQVVQQLHSKTSQQLAALTAPITHSALMDIFQRLVNDLDTEGRYLFLNAVANQLRYPNNHTYYFSCVLLLLFAEASADIVQEQSTRVLLERLIVNRSHPWGLLITFIELIKNPRYSFWTHSFTRCAPEIDKLFESVARSCMTPTLKPNDDDLSGSLPADGLKG